MAASSQRIRRLHLVRHGEVENPGAVVYGTLPGFELSLRGREQVTRAAHELRGRLVLPPQLICSPLERTRQSAELLRDHLPVADEVMADTRLIEAGSVLDGLPRRFAPVPYLRRWLDAEARARRETPGTVLLRVVSALEEALARAGDERELVVVSHQFPIAMARVALERGSLSGRAAGVALAVVEAAPWLFARARCGPGSVTSVELVVGGATRVRYWEPPG